MKPLTIGCSAIALVMILVLLLGALGGCAYAGAMTDSNLFGITGGAIMAQVLTHNLSEPLNGASTAKVDINTESGNLTIDRLDGGEPLLASGALQYYEKQGIPSQSVALDNGQATLTLKGGRATQPWFRFPWDACNGASEWQVHLNPKVASDITARSGGGNVKLDLAGMTITRVFADTGGGNLNVVLPDDAANLDVTAKTGAGNVTVEIGAGTKGGNTLIAGSGAGNVVVRVPDGIAARIHATSGMGKVMVDARFGKIDKTTYQSSDYDTAANKIEITAGSGAGNVSVNAK